MLGLPAVVVWWFLPSRGTGFGHAGSSCGRAWALVVAARGP